MARRRRDRPIKVGGNLIPNSFFAEGETAPHPTGYPGTFVLRPLQVSYAERVGSEARRLLRTGVCGSVLAVLSDTVYLRGEREEILWISRRGTPAHRRFVSALYPTFRAAPGDPFGMANGHLNISNRFLLEINSAVEWAPPVIGSEVIPMPQLKREVRKLVRTLKVPEGMDGFGEVISWLAGRSPNSPLLARKAVEALGKACLAGDLERALILARELIGLGAGLTPSGDDFVGGILFAAKTLKLLYGTQEWKEGAVNHLITWAKEKTHEISYALLVDFSQGHGPEPLHDLTAGLLRGKEMGGLVESAIHLTRIGHTSGWDILAGFLMGIQFTEYRYGRRAAVA